MMELVITVCLVCKTSLEKNNMYERNKKVKEKEEARLKELKKIDKDFLDLSLLREKKKIYRLATCSGIQDFIKNLNIQVSYLALCLKIKLSRQMSSRE